MSETLFRNPCAEFTLMRNDIFDQMMPALSSNAWKVLCVAFRQSWGGDGITNGTAPAPTITISQFAEKTGIADRADIETAIEECVDAGYLTVPESDETPFSFVLNENFPQAPPAPKVGDDKVAEEMTPLPPELEPAYQALIDFAQAMGAEPDLSQVRRAVLDNGVDAVTAWIAMGRVMTHMEPPLRFKTVLERLMQGVPPLPLSMFEPEDPRDVVSPIVEVSAPSRDAPPLDVSAMSAAELWQTALKTLKTKMRSSKYKFLAPTEGIALEGNVLTVSTANERVREWLESGQLASLILETFQSITGESIALKFVVQKE